MPVNRYFVDANFKDGAPVELVGQEHHHLIHVMRSQVGDQVELVNGKGGLASATVIKMGRREAVLEVNLASQHLNREFQLILGQASVRANRLDFILEKGTELGMSELWLFPADRSEKIKITESQLERMHHVMIAAMKQCGRLYLPRLVVCDHFSKWKQFDGLVCFGDLHCSRKDAIDWQNQSRILFLVGPEGGFSPNEEACLAKMGAQGLKLHDNILRAETAALAGLSIIHFLHG
jgi:16S rRNA (uracil1498-N3)-methyltransferase